MATVGYGDAVPTTAAGKMMAAVIILFGYSLIVVPTGIVSAEIAGRAAVGALQRAPGGVRPRTVAGTGPEGSADLHAKVWPVPVVPAMPQMHITATAAASGSDA